jgi:phosphoglycolate phosphatase
MSSLSALIFDLDGTLSDPYVGITRSYRYAREKLGLEALAEDVLRGLIGPPMHVVFSVLSDGEPGLFDAAVTAYRERYADVGLYENFVYPGIPQALSALAARYRLFVCTSKPTAFATRIVEHFDLMRYFNGVYGCEFDGTRADKGELLHWLIDREGLDPAAAAMIGDRKFDIVAALHNDVMPFGVLWGHGSEAELLEAGAVRCFTAPPDVSVHFVV